MRITEIIKDTSGKDRGSEGVTFTGAKTAIATEEEAKKARALNIYKRAVEELQRISTAVREGKPLKIDNLEELTEEFVNSLLSDHYLFLQVLYKEAESWDLPTHSVNTAIIAFKIGLGLKYDKSALNTMVLITFLHDLGMLTIPEELRNKPGRLKPEEYEIIKRHSMETYRILKGLGDRYSMLAEITYQEHEKEDGSGYPRGLKGNEIHEFAKIIGLADIYGAMIHPRPQRKRFLPFDAVKQIIAVFKGCFPTRIMKAMINELSAFPVGIYVKLNTNEIGRVISTNRLTPLRPTVDVIFNPQGQRLKEPKTLDLGKEPLLNIISASFPEDLGTR